MRAEENRLLADRVQVDRAAMSRLQWVSIALLVVTVGMLAWIAWLLARNARRQRESTDTLRTEKRELEGQVGARAADLRDSNERLRSIIDSAVDGIIVIDAKGRSKRSIAAPSGCSAIPSPKSSAATSAC